LTLPPPPNTPTNHTKKISDAISVYDAYCISAGYPTNPNAQATATTDTAGSGPQATVITSDIVYTFTVGSSTFRITEPGAVQTITTAPSTTSSSAATNPSSISPPKVNIAGIVGGIVGALVLIAIPLAIFYIWLPRRQKAKARKEAELQGQVGSTFIPKRTGGGRAELQGEETEKGVAVEDVGVVEAEKGKVEMDARGMARYGLRPEELDSEGRFVGELHGDGREVVPGVELEGSEVRR
jgi:hypothetical protein